MCFEAVMASTGLWELRVIKIKRSFMSNNINEYRMYINISGSGSNARFEEERNVFIR